MQDKELTTPNGNKVLLKGYVSAKASREQQELLMTDLKISDLEHIGDKLEKGDIPAVLAMKSLDVLVKDCLKSLDGNADNAYGRLLDLPEEDYTFVQNAVAELRQAEMDKKKEASGQSADSTTQKTK